MTITPHTYTVPELDPARLAQMINTAVSQPQLPPLPVRAGFIARAGAAIMRIFAPQEQALRAVAVTACLFVLVLAVTFGSPLPGNTNTAATGDVMAEVSDMMTLDLLESMS